jgi:quinol monooxygenase YgiN
MATLFVRHTVKDYATFKRVYDEVAPLRKEWGVTRASVHRDAEDPNTIVVTHRFKDVEDAKAFAHADELKSAMEKAGVKGAPTFWFTTDVEETAY